VCIDDKSCTYTGSGIKGLRDESQQEYEGGKMRGNARSTTAAWARPGTAKHMSAVIGVIRGRFRAVNGIGPFRQKGPTGV
jgi:hypothetical protein